MDVVLVLVLLVDEVELVLLVDEVELVLLVLLVDEVLHIRPHTSAETRSDANA